MGCFPACNNAIDLSWTFNDTMGSEVNVQDRSLVTVQNIPGTNVQGENIPSENIHEGDPSKQENNISTLFCVDSQVNGIQIRLLLDSECFISETLVEDNDMPYCKSQGKLKVYLAGGSLKSSDHCLT